MYKSTLHYPGNRLTARVELTTVRQQPGNITFPSRADTPHISNLYTHLAPTIWVVIPCNA